MLVELVNQLYVLWLVKSPFVKIISILLMHEEICFMETTSAVSFSALRVDTHLAKFSQAGTVLLTALAFLLTSRIIVAIAAIILLLACRRAVGKSFPITLSLHPLHRPTSAPVAAKDCGGRSRASSFCARRRRCISDCLEPCALSDKRYRGWLGTRSDCLCAGWH